MGRGQGQEIEETRVIDGTAFKRGRRKAIDADSGRLAETAEDFALVGDWLENIIDELSMFAFSESFITEDPWLQGSPDHVRALYRRWQQAQETGQLFRSTDAELRLLAQIAPFLRKNDASGRTWSTLAADDIASYFAGSREIPEQG